MISRDVTFFLDQLWREGFLKGASQQEAFLVRCDTETNSPATQNRGQVNVDVWLSPFRPAEYIGLRVTQEVDALAREDGA